MQKMLFISAVMIAAIIATMPIITMPLIEDAKAQNANAMFPFLKQVQTGNGPGGICTVDLTMSPAFAGVLISNFHDDTVQAFNSKEQLVDTIPVGDGPLGICVSMTPQGFRGWVPNFLDDTVTLFDITVVDQEITDLTPVMDIPVGDGAAFICASTTPFRIYVANTLENTVTVIDSGAPVPSVIGTIPVGKAPTGLGVDRIRDLIWVANSGDDTVMLIDSSGPPTAKSIIATIPVGDKPAAFPGSGIGANRFLGTIAIPNTGDDTVSIIDADPNDDGKFKDAAVVATLSVMPNPVASGASVSTDIEVITHLGSNFITIIDMDPNDDLASDDATVLGTVQLTPGLDMTAPTSAGVQATTNKILVTNSDADTMTYLLDTTGPTIQSLGERGTPPGCPC